MNERRTLMIACRVVVEEMLPLPPGVAVETLEMSLHENPAKLRATLQAMIDASAGDRDAIILGYGMCSQATVGLRANGCRLVIPRVDDCIGMFLGSRDSHIAQLREEPGTYFLTKGWVAAGVTTPFAAYDRVAARWGPERADRLMGSVMKRYKRLVYIRTGSEETLAEDRARARAMASRFNLRYEELAGSRAVVERLVFGPWGDGFVVIPPDGTVTLDDFVGAGRERRPEPAGSGAQEAR